MKNKHGGGAVFTLGDLVPDIAEDVFIAPGAQVIGDVHIGAGSSIWNNTIVRGDVHEIRIGSNTNVQDGSVVHVTHDKFGTYIGDNVLIGHSVMLHGCILEDWSFVGLSTVVMDGCVIETNGMLGAGGLLPPGKRIKSGQLWVGSPARYVRNLSSDEIARNRESAPYYAALAQKHLKELAPYEKSRF